MKKVKIIYDIETYTYHDSTDRQISLLYKLAEKLRKKQLNKIRKSKLNKLNDLSNGN